MLAHRPLRHVLAVGVVALLLLAALPATGRALPLGPLDDLVSVTSEDLGVDFAPRLVTVTTATRDARNLVASSGLDVTEHAGHDYVEVVVHSAEELELLDSFGLDYDVRIDDLLAREVERQQLDASFAAANPVTDLPSGRNAYRTLADFGAEIDKLAAENPGIARRVSIGSSVEGRDLTGIEIGVDVDRPEDGRPVLLMFGVHHAREWPSAEAPMEFAHDLVEGYADATHPDHDRIVDLLERGRAIIVPVSNPDGYDASRTSGDLVDLRELDGGGTVSILGTPGNAYKRKNCRYVDGQTQPAGTCVAVPSNGGFGIGIDLNRNYGALWGGPGADGTLPRQEEDGSTGFGAASPIYHGPAPFSEPETQAIRRLISTRQVTTLISNHTFSNLLLRPVGVEPNTIGPDGFPIGFSPDECFTTATGDDRGMQAVGELMTAQTGYSNQFGWELYDTTGTTEDYSYNATGGYGYTFEIGPHEFHPPYEQVIDEYLGTSDAAQAVRADDTASLTSDAGADCAGDPVQAGTVGGGLREAYLIAFENAVDSATHATVTGLAPAGAEISVERSGTFPTWDGTQIADTVATTMTATATDRFTYHVNPSTRPFVASRRVNELSPITEFTASGPPPPPQSSVDVPIEVDETGDALVVEMHSAAMDVDDYDLELYAPDGTLLGSSAIFGSSERVTYQPGGGLPLGTYQARVINYAAVSDWALAGGVFDAAAVDTPRLFEAWTVTCRVDGAVAGQAPALVERGGEVDVGDLCDAGLRERGKKRPKVTVHQRGRDR